MCTCFIVADVCMCKGLQYVALWLWVNVLLQDPLVSVSYECIDEHHTFAWMCLNMFLLLCPYMLMNVCVLVFECLLACLWVSAYIPVLVRVCEPFVSLCVLLPVTSVLEHVCGRLPEACGGVPRWEWLCCQQLWRSLQTHRAALLWVRTLSTVGLWELGRGERTQAVLQHWYTEGV
jgi:hypothetical protein